MSTLPTLSAGQYQLVYNMLSLAIAAMLGSFIFFVLARSELTAKYRPAMIMSSLVVAIAGYHYFRIFESWHGAYTLTNGEYVASGAPFNDAYRYVDWLLTVPLLCAELIAVLALAAGVRGKMMGKLVVAAVLMIALGYPGEASTETGPRVMWAALSTVPFTYILYVLWVQLTKVLATETATVRKRLDQIRWLLLATWGFYPIAYALPLLKVGGASATVGVQIGYSLADILAKCGYGFMIFAIARAKMEAEGVTASDVAPAVAPLAASR
jgi:bacteriorhodopsin